MIRPLRRIALLGLVLAGATGVLRRVRSQAKPADGGVLIADVPLYDRVTGWLLGSFYDGVADDLAAAVAPAASVLDVGCGPGHLAARLADRGLAVTGIDLDPAMIARAEQRLGSRAALTTADVASLPYSDSTFDVVVSTISMHHWADQTTGLAEIGRVLKRGGVALIFDFGGARVPLHGHIQGPAPHVERSVLDLVTETRWRWPGPVSLLRRVEARPAD